MAYFAEIDSNNIVVQVIAVADKNTSDENNIEVESIGIEFCKNLLGQGKTWVQTSYNHNFRKQYAGVGMTYDSVKDKFIFKQPYPSWALDVNDDWQAPTPMPDDDKMYTWDEDTTAWVEVSE